MESVERPTGLTIIAVLSGLIGLMNVLDGLDSMTALPTGPQRGLVTAVSIALLALGIAGLTFANGAWALRHWAWPMGIAFSVGTIALFLFILSQGGAATGVFDVVFSGLVIVYLWRPDTRQSLGHS